MFDQRAYRRRVKQSGDTLLAEIWRNPHAADSDWEMAHTVTEAESIIAEWPIDKLEGGAYDLVIDEDVDRGLHALTWWMIVFVESYVDPERGSAGARERATALLPVAEEIRTSLTPHEGTCLHQSHTMAVVSKALTRREPRPSDLPLLHPCESRTAVSLRTLVKRSPRGAARLAKGDPFITV